MLLKKQLVNGRGRKKLGTIYDTVSLVGRLTVPLEPHFDDRPHHTGVVGLALWAYNLLVCHSERSDESRHFVALVDLSNAGILRFAQNDRRIGFALAHWLCARTLSF